MPLSTNDLKIHSFIKWIVILEAFFLTASCTTIRPQPDRDRERPPLYSKAPSHEENSRSGRDAYWYRSKQWSATAPDKNSAKNTEEAPSTSASDADEPGQDDFFDQPLVFNDDLDPDSLKLAIRNQLAALKIQDVNKTQRFASGYVTHRRLIDTLESFLDLLAQDLSEEALRERIQQDYILIRAGGDADKVLVTGYYTPIMPASRIRTEEYRFPLYRLPEEPPHLQVVGYHGEERWAAAQSADRLARQLTRKQIDDEGALENRGLEIAWLRDDLDRFFLHIQGSGILQFRDGSVSKARFAGANNYSYKGIGRLMIDDGVIEVGQGSMQGIKQYFKDHPQDIPKYLHQNDRYIFFDLSEGGPMGSGGSEVVGGRSIATDKGIYPAGGLAFIRSRKPVLNESNEIKSWEAFTRFVVDQDTGSAIRGPARADLYFGIGDKAGAKAGRFHERSEIYYLLKK